MQAVCAWLSTQEPPKSEDVYLTYTYNRFQACRFGVEGQLIDPAGNIEQIKQFDLAAQWPVNPQSTLLGRWNYSLNDRKTLEAIAGVEYNGDCWVLRAVLHRLATTVDQTNTSFFIQLELNGLARVGTSPLELLRRSVPGYVPLNDPVLMQRDYTIDPLPEF